MAELVHFPFAFYHENSIKTNFFNKVKQILTSRAVCPEDQGHSIASHVVFKVREAADSKPRMPCPLRDFLEVLMDMATCIRPDHEWHDIFLDALEILRARPSTINGLSSKNDKRNLWSRLGGFSLEEYERNMRLNRIEGFSNLHETFDISTEATRKRNFASFMAWSAAREVERNPTSWDYHFGIADIRAGLERDLQEQAIQKPFHHLGRSTDVWIACNWLNCCADDIYERIVSGKAPPDTLKTKYGLGKLCPKHIGLVSLDRWYFWKARIAELCDDISLNDPTKTHCRRALRAMEEAELSGA